ncbi:hypothetical protein AVEN_166515-1 [Araneus ventricosus]|uniref:Uncharacterized protein n=1 Tax=Araneus ventricosus TaxID=182803 RepID=A0A4Y2IRA3_ARAVE|nr:hypothetical protein AVEN_166515-1 [Araneus ventricosus]
MTAHTATTGQEQGTTERVKIWAANVHFLGTSQDEARMSLRIIPNLILGWLGTKIWRFFWNIPRDVRPCREDYEYRGAEASLESLLSLVRIALRSAVRRCALL